MGLTVVLVLCFNNARLRRKSHDGLNLLWELVLSPNNKIIGLNTELFSNFDEKL